MIPQKRSICQTDPLSQKQNAPVNRVRYASTCRDATLRTIVLQIARNVPIARVFFSSGEPYTVRRAQARDNADRFSEKESDEPQRDILPLQASHMREYFVAAERARALRGVLVAEVLPPAPDNPGFRLVYFERLRHGTGPFLISDTHYTTKYTSCLVTRGAQDPSPPQ